VTRRALLARELAGIVTLRSVARWLWENYRLNLTLQQVREYTLAGIGPLGSIGATLTKCPDEFHVQQLHRWAFWLRRHRRVLEFPRDVSTRELVRIVTRKPAPKKSG
jgi:hypothetical protein